MYIAHVLYIRPFYCISLLLLAVVSSSIAALEISPLSVELKTDARPSYQQIIVRNTSNRTVPVEVSLNRIIFNPNTEQPGFTLSEDERLDDLLVFPPALILEPGATQSVRVQWNNDTLISESKSYFVRFSQPQLSQTLQTSTPQSGVKVFIHFNAVVHVSTTLLAPKLRIKPDSIELSEDGQRLRVLVANVGDSYHYLKQTDLLKLSANKKSQLLLSASQFEQLGEVFFPPNATRILSLPISETWSKGDSLHFENSIGD